MRMRRPMRGWLFGFDNFRVLEFQVKFYSYWYFTLRILLYSPPILLLQPTFIHVRPRSGLFPAVRDATLYAYYTLKNTLNFSTRNSTYSRLISPFMRATVPSTHHRCTHHPPLPLLYFLPPQNPHAWNSHHHLATVASHLACLSLFSTSFSTGRKVLLPFHRRQQLREPSTPIGSFREEWCWTGWGSSLQVWLQV